MNPDTPETEPGLDQDLETFAQLPVKTRELEALQDHAQKTTGKESLTLHQAIREKAKQKTQLLSE